MELQRFYRKQLLHIRGVNEMKRGKILICTFAVMLLCTGCGEAVSETIGEIREPEYKEVTVELSEFEDKFYYGQLSEEEQLIYREIYQGVLEHEEAIIVHGTDPNYVNSILEPIVYDFPELFWIDGASSATSYDESLLKEGYTIIKPVYLYTKEESEQREAFIEQEKEAILSAIPESYGEYETIKYLYDYLVDRLDYVEGAPDNQNICSALIQNETVCAGYAKTLQYLLSEMDLYSIYVVGDVTDETGTDGHAWNIVRCNGNYYNVDVTWADPIQEENDYIMERERIYDYLLCSDAELADTHSADRAYFYPSCMMEDLNYYRLQGAYYESVDYYALLNRMKESIRNKADSVTFKLSEEIYEQGKNLIIDELAGEAAQYLCQRYGLWEVHYYYEENEFLNRVTLYWQYK